jgi:hypothetical protein
MARFYCNWEIHLDGAGALLGTIDSIVGTTGQSIHSSLLGGSKPYPSASVEEYPIQEMIGLKFLTTIYIWADIARCASVDWHYPTAHLFQYKIHLEKNLVDLGSLMGCSNWAMIIIMETARLEEDWKRARQPTPDYTTLELNQRAATLKTKLDDGLAIIRKKLLPISPLERDRNRVTEIFGISALIYLEIITAGVTEPDLCKMEKYVKRSIAALEALSPHRLRSVPWPFCVAGCMATTQEEKNSFRRILKSTIEANISLGITLNGLEIMEQWWTMRRGKDEWQLGGVVCWRAAMDSLNLRILLV